MTCEFIILFKILLISNIVSNSTGPGGCAVSAAAQGPKFIIYEIYISSAENNSNMGFGSVGYAIEPPTC